MATETNPTQNQEAEADIDPERVAYEAAQSQPTAVDRERPIALSLGELSAGVFALMLWFGFFSGGILIATQPYRAAIASPTATWSMLTSWLIVCAFWTITNIGILSCIAAFLGALGRRTRFTSRTDPLQASIVATRPGRRGLPTYYASAIMRGFGVYTLLLAGLLVLATESLVSPEQEAYMRLAPMVSIISFYAGYDPNMFANLLDRVKSFLQTKDE